MPDISYNQAITELNALLSRGAGSLPTVAELKSIVSRARVTQIDSANLSLDRVGAINGAILYSGFVKDGLHTGALAAALHAVDPSLATIDDSHVGRLLDRASPFYAEVAKAVARENPTLLAEEVNNLIGSSTGGFWSTASERFASVHANGKIIALVPNLSGLDTSKIFGSNEIKALMQGSGTGAINGIPLSELRLRYNALASAGGIPSALDDITRVVSVKSLSDAWANVSVDTSGGATRASFSSAFFESVGISNGTLSSPGYSATGAKPIATAVAEGKWLDTKAVGIAFDKASYLRGLARAGKILGPVGDLIELGALTGTVVGLLNAGDRDGAARAAAVGLGSIGGGALAASSAATFAAPLLAGGPVGWVAYGIIVVGAGFVGSETGQYVVDKAYTLFAQTLPEYYQRTNGNPIVWLADGLGAYHNFVTVTLPNGLEYAARFTKQLVNGDIDIVKLFTPENEDIITGEIIVTANRRTGQSSAVFTGDWSTLQNQTEVGQAFAAFLLDYARSGQDVAGGGASSGGSSGFMPSTLAAAKSNTGTVNGSSAKTPVLRTNADGTVTLGAVRYRPIGTDNAGGFRLEEQDGSLLDGRIVDIGGIPTWKPSVRHVYNGRLTVKTELGPDGNVRNTVVSINNNPLGFSFQDVGSALGSVLGYRLSGGNQLTGILASASLRTIGENLGEAIDVLSFGSTENIGVNIKTVLRDFDTELFNNLKGAGLGAVSSYLTAELVNALGIDGFAGELANAAGGAVIGQIVQNIARLASESAPLAADGSKLTALSDIGVGAITAVGSFLGNKLANQVHTFDTVGGQIGAAVGSAISVALDAELIATLAATGQIELIAVAVVIAVIDAFIGNLIGGLIGSIFGGTPRSGADAQWDANQGQFVVANVWSKKGGSKDSARSLATSATQNLNAVLSAAGGTLLNPEAVQAGNYGMRKSDFVYQTAESKDQNNITFRISSKQKNAVGRIVGYGTVQALIDPDFQIAGGDVYVKRAIYRTFEMGGIDATNFETGTLFGNIISAQQFHSYLANANVINALVAAQPDTAFSAETLITLARADELGLNRRYRSDWFGGFTFLVKEAGTSATNVEFGFDYDFASRQVSRKIGLGGLVFDDTIDVAGQTSIEGTSVGEVIDLRTAQLANQIGYTVDGHLNNDIAVSGADFTAKTTSVSFAANSRRATVTVTVTNDSVAEAAESFLAGLNNAPAMRIMGGDAVATIVDGTAALPTLMVGDSYAWEDDGYAVFRLSLSKVATTAVTVSLALGDGRASGAGADYGSTSATNLQVSSDGVTWTNATSVTFAAGSKERFVRTAIIADNVANPAYVAGGSEPQFLNVEGNERFTLSAAVTAGATALANGTQTVTGTGTIIDGAGNEPLVWMDDVVVDEATGQATFTLSRSRALATATTVDFATADRRVLDIDIAATVDGGDGNDTIYASNLGDNIFGGAGADTLYGGRLDDWLLGGDGNDILDAGTADQAALGGDGNYLNGGAGNDTLRGREGSDWLEGGEGTDILTGGAGDDILVAGAGANDDMKGGLGSDQYLVRRGDGTDKAEEDANGAPVASGAGDAITQRMAAIELWRNNPATSGALRPDWLGTSAGVQAGAISGGEDAVVFGMDINIGDIRLLRSGTSTVPANDLIVQVMTTTNGVESFSGTQLTIKDWFTNPFKRVEWLKFADGNEMRIGDLTSFITGGAGNDVLIGTNGNDFVYGGAGNDNLTLLDGDDVGNGATGDDMVSGGTGRDMLIGGLGADLLLGDAGSDTITGDGGADEIYGGADDTNNDPDPAKKKNGDILSGGRGDNDWVVGGSGDDTFKYTRGDGRDTYFDEYVNYWDVVWTNAGLWNTAAGYSYNGATGEVTGPGGIVIRKNLGTVAEPDFQWLGRFAYDSVSKTFKRFNPPVGATTIVANAGTDTIEFAPGIDLQDVILRRPTGSNDLVLAISSEDEDLVNTSVASDSVTIKDWYLAPGQIEKLAFYQTGILDIAPAKMTLIAGTDGANGTMATPLQGTVGADWITGAAGDDVIAAGTGNDILAGNSGSDTLKGEGGADVLYGGTGNDILDGGGEGDILLGGAGQDAASYASAAAAVRAHLSASWANTGDAAGDEYYAIEDITGSSGADTLGGDSGQNELTGGIGNDVLMGNVGDDTYVWNIGDGADSIVEGSFTVQEAVTIDGVLATGYIVSIWAKTGATSGTNSYWRLQIKGADGVVVYDDSSYLYASSATPTAPVPSAYIQAGWTDGFVRTNGQQVTRQLFDTAEGGVDEIEFGANISLSDLTFIQDGSNLIIRHGGLATSQITVKLHTLSRKAVEYIKFNDGFSVSLSSILVATSSAQLSGTSSDDLIAGQAGDFVDSLSGGNGNDVLVGYAGNDTLQGGSGDDSFEGGMGADTIDGGSNSVSSDGPAAGDTARYVRSTAAITVDLNLSTAQGGANGADSVGDILSGIENVVGSAFADTITGNAMDNRLFGLAGDDIMRGGAGQDVLAGDVGNDTLYGDDGEDNLSGGDGNDALRGGNENDILDGGDGADGMLGEAGADTLSGGSGDDRLNGGSGDDILSGGSENDTLTGGSENDTLSGGVGDDTLNGNSGDDIYVLERNSGSDTIVDIEGANRIQFDASVSFESIWLTRVGNDLRVAVIGGNAVALLEDFFLAAGGGKLKAIDTPTHSIFLDHADTLALVTAMTAAVTNPAVTPTAMPVSVTTLLDRYWHAGGKAVPTGPAAPRAFAMAEDGSLVIDGNYGVIDHDQNIVAFSVKAGHGPVIGAITALNTSTGALTYKPLPDAIGDDNFVIIATDADGQSVELPVTVKITPINDAPRNLAATGAVTVLESAPGSTTVNGTVVGQFAATDIEGDAISFALGNNAGGRFSITQTGELRVLDATLLNREIHASHAIQVIATDTYGASIVASFTVTIGNVNEAPDAPTLTSSRGISDEYVAGVTASNISTMVANFVTSDPDGIIPTLIFAAAGNPSNFFKIVGNQVQFALDPDFEALASAGYTVSDSDGDGFGEVVLTVRVKTTDGQLSSAATIVSVLIEDVNQQHTMMAFSNAAASIEERDRLAAGTARPAVVLGTISVTDPDRPGMLTGQHGFAVYEGSSTTVSTRFAFDTSNQLVLLANQSLDYEGDGASVTLRIRAIDKSSAPLSLDQNFTFTIVNKDDVLDGTAAAEILTGQQNRDIINGLAGNDTISAGAGDDLVEGGDGNDKMWGQDGSDIIYGQSGIDYLYGDAGNDILWGGAHNDRMYGGSGNDTLYGEAGNEGIRAQGSDGWRGFTTQGLVGGDGDDILSGGDGDDNLDGENGADQLIGGAGFDGVSYASSTAGVAVNLATGIGVGGTAQGDSLSGIELIQGSVYVDILTGSAAADVFYGGAGNDVVKGGAGDDFLLGEDGDDQLDAEAGNDYLDGGAGNDILIGGDGNDTYFIARNRGNDRIRNYDPSGSNFDHLALEETILYTDVWFDRVTDAGAVSTTGNHLKLTFLGVAGTEGSVTIENWFTIPDRTLPANYFKVDLISDGDVRAVVPINVDALVGLMASIPAGTRPVTRDQMANLRRTNLSFATEMENYWDRLSSPQISDTIALASVEPLDNGTQVVSFSVRAWYDDQNGSGIIIPASNIDLFLSAPGDNLSNYVTAIDYGLPDSNGNRTVKLTLSSDASTHLLVNGKLPLQLKATIRGTNRNAADDFTLAIAPTADTPTLTQLASPGGNAGLALPIYVAATSSDTDGSERVDVLISAPPAGYVFRDAAGQAVGTQEGSGWRFTAVQAEQLFLFIPTGKWQNAVLSVYAQTIDGASIRNGSTQQLTVFVNGAPTGVTLTGSVTENATADTFVGTLAGIDPDTAEGVTAPTSFQILNDAGGRYRLETVGSNRLVIRNGGPSLFDYEAANRNALHTITVRVTDSAGLYVDRTIVVSVTNVNETPNAPGGGATVWSFFDESGLGSNPAASGKTVATLAMSDPDGTTPTLRFAANGNPGNWFTIVGNQIQLAAGFTHNFEWFESNGYGVYDWNGDGRIDAHIANVRVEATDGSSVSAETLVQVFISDVEEQPINLVLEASNLFSETLSGNTAHAGQIIARFTMADPDGPSPSLVIVGGNQNGWFQSVNGNNIAFSPGVNFTADWLRAYKGQYGTDAAFNYDTDGDGLKEIRVATLTLAAQDATGLQSAQAFSYNVLIEDKNEAPVWDASPVLQVQEDRRYGFYIYNLRATDVDGPQSEILYMFAAGRLFYDAQLNMHFSASPDERFMVNTWDGRVFAGPGADFNFESGNNIFSYQMLATDRSAGANSISSSATVRFSIADLNEPHVLVNASGSRAEVSGLPPLTPVFDLRSTMLQDPEGRNMAWTFADGSNQSGIWTLSPDGKLSLTAGGIDYEALTTRYDTYGYYDEWGYYTEYQVPVRDYSLATQALSVRAYDGLHLITGTFTAAITDVNEGPSLGWSPRFIVRDDQGDGQLGRLYGYDPETGALASSYSISVRSATESFLSPGSSADVDNSGNPSVWVNYSDGRLYFDTPSDGEWEGGIKNHPVYGGRWYYQLDYIVDVTMTDASGVTGTESFTITFLKHDTSGVLPVVLDLDGDGLELVDFETSAVTFDMDVDGIADRTGWVGADDGMLVLDRNGNGTIDDSSEISFVRDYESAVTDLEGLRAWDSNRDGLLSAGDADFSQFRIWRDANQNGISETDELFALGELGITELNLTLNVTGNELVGDANVVYATSDYTKADGATGTVGDVSLAFDPSKIDEDMSHTGVPAPEDLSLAAPIVFDLDNDNMGLVALADSQTHFDMNKDGVADKAGWIEQGDAFLALDRNGNGKVDDISEISFVADKAGAKTDLEGLAAFDSNGDGFLNGEDQRFVEFRVWRDGNADGRTDAGELLSLAEAGIASISLSGIATGETETVGKNIVYNSGSFALTDGSQGRLLDVGLAYKALSALADIEFQESEWGGKAKNYRVSAGDGQVHVGPSHPNGALSSDAGKVAAAAIFSFNGRTVGMLSTILIDIDGDGLEARRSQKTQALFDMNGDGVRDDTGWISGGDGMLVIDRDGDGAITHASEISFLAEKEDAKNAWDGLATLDNNKDGKLDVTDARFGELKVWIDHNADGVSQNEELKSLADLGITEIGLRNLATADSVKAGNNLALSTATFTRKSGVTGTIGNVAMAFTPAPEHAMPDDPMAARAAASLAQAMSTFGADASQSVLRRLDADGMGAQDWLMASAA